MVEGQEGTVTLGQGLKRESMPGSHHVKKNVFTLYYKSTNYENEFTPQIKGGGREVGEEGRDS